MGPRGEIGPVLVYADHPIIARAAFKAAVDQISERAHSAAQPWRSTTEIGARLGLTKFFNFSNHRA